MMVMCLVHYAQQAPQEPHTLGRCPWTCTMSWKHSFHHSIHFIRSTGISNSYGDPWAHLCAPTPTGSTTDLLLGEQGATPLSIIFRGFYSSLWNFKILLGLWRAPRHVHIIIWPPCEAYLFHLWASLVGLSPIGVLFAHYFISRG